MKALSVKQPWANAIARGQKTIETRTWGTAYRGPLLIVSSRKPHVPPAGSVVAVAELVDCRAMTTADEPAACCRVYPKAMSWVLRNVRPVRPFPLKGKLGIFECSVALNKLDFVHSAAWAMLPRYSRCPGKPGA